MDDFTVHEYRSDIDNEPQQLREINRDSAPLDEEWDEIKYDGKITVGLPKCYIMEAAEGCPICLALIEMV